MDETHLDMNSTNMHDSMCFHVIGWPVCSTCRHYLAMTAPIGDENDSMYLTDGR